MATRTIICKAYSGMPMENGSALYCDLQSDTGPVSVTGGTISATIEVTRVKTSRSDCKLLVKFDSATADTLAVMGPLAQNDTLHTESMALSACKAGLLTNALSSAIYLVLETGGADGTTHATLSMCEVKIVVQSIDNCTPPGTPWLSTTQSTGDAVVLRWSAGAGGADNAFRYYEVQRCLSINGSTWGAWEPLTQTTDTYAVVQPPATVGHRYRYMVRTVGAAGESGASPWVVSSETLLRYEITRCGTPGNVTLSATESSGSVLMSWTAASAGVANSVSYYEVERCLSTDGGTTWSNVWERVGTTSSLYMWVDPPATDGHMYRFYVRAVGTAGTEYASYWVQCGKTLKKVKAALIAYTDPEILPGITEVKAVHITELQTNINLVRAAANYTPVEFTVFRASYTSLGGWNTHITELRSAIDGMGISHETWLALGENCPRADVLMQLRRVVEAVAND